MNSIVTAKYFGKNIVGVVKYDLDTQSPREDDNVATLACWHPRYRLGDADKGGWGKGRRDSGFDERSFKCQLLQDADISTDLVDDDECTDDEGYLDQDKFDKLFNERADKLIEQHIVMTPLFLYDHSGLFISTASFSCPWDSGQVGYAYITLKKAWEVWGPEGAVLNTYSWDGETHFVSGMQTLRSLAQAAIESEVKTYDSYLRGEAYGWIIYDFTEAVKRGEVSEQDFEDTEKLDFGKAEQLDSCWGYIGDEDYVEASMSAEAKAIVDSLPEQLKLEM